MESNVLHPTSKEFKELISGDKIVLVDFFATWCGPCKMLAPVIEHLSDKYKDKILVAKIDVDEQEELAAKYAIQSVPTVILFKDGKILSTEVGLNPISHYTGVIDSYL